MSSRRCTRSWEAEAVHGGRVTGSEQSAFATHAIHCAACAAHIRRLERLGEELRRMRVVRVDDLAARRQRQLLLAALDAAATDPLRPRSRWLPIAVAALVLSGIAFIVRLWLQTNIAASSAAPNFLVDLESAGARWSRHYEEHLVVVELEDGLLTLRSSAQSPGARLVLRVPDGEIEDVGTRFAVLVASGRTRCIEVFEGQVVFRAKDQSVHQLSAGQRWELEAPSSAVGSGREAATGAPGEVALPPRAESPPSQSSSGRPAIAPGPHPKSAPKTNKRAENDDTDAAGQLFADGMAALRAGHFLTASSVFETFIGAYPSDPRTEDASYLRAVALARMGDVEGAAELALKYLTRYPNGLRRVEADRLTKQRRP